MTKLWHGLNSRALVWLGLACVALALPGCWLAAAKERVEGKQVNALYDGLKGHSVAVVIWADNETVWEYASAQEDIASFINQQLRTDMPSIRLMNYRDVLNWQQETLHWEALEVKDIGKHFSVDRVIYIELLEYSSHEPGSADLLRGHIRANAKVYETDTPGDAPAWHGEIDTYFPKDSPADPGRSSEITVRKRALEEFSKTLVGYFYDHKEKEPLLRDKYHE